MNRAEALTILRLDAEHDAHAIEQSYWSLVRRAQSQDDEHASQREVERLNAAYALLAPAPQPQAVTDRRLPASAAINPTRAVHSNRSDGIPEAVLAWLESEARLMLLRWRGRTLEVGVMFGTALVLAVLALAAGASPLLVVVCVVVCATAVWAPWRSTDDDDTPDG